MDDDLIIYDTDEELMTETEKEILRDALYDDIMDEMMEGGME